MATKQFQIKDMHCTGCVMTIEGVLEDLSGVKEARANLARQTADVDYDESKVTIEQLIEAIREAGYSPT